MFVTGGTGFLGRHIVNGPEAERWEVVAPSSAALDLRYADSVMAVIRDWRPTAVVHTAYRRGDRSSIVEASRNVAEAAARCGARLVHLSTDALFRGRFAPYTERDNPTPVHSYGRDKADAERAVAEACPAAVIVRTSLMLSRRQLSGHELTVRDAIEGRANVEFFTDEIRSPVLVDDLAASVTELAARPEITGVLHLGGPDPLSRAQLAILIAHHHSWDASKLRFSTLEASGLHRPSRVVLDSSKARSLGIAVRGPAEWA